MVMRMCGGCLGRGKFWGFGWSWTGKEVEGSGFVGDGFRES